MSLSFQGAEWADLPGFGPQSMSFTGAGACSTALSGQKNKFEVTSAAEHTPHPYLTRKPNQSTSDNT